MVTSEKIAEEQFLPRASAFARSLQSRRGLFNTRFAQARHICPVLDPGDFKNHLLNVVRPVVDACEAAGGTMLDEVVEVLYDTSLTLVVKDLAGRRSRCPLIDSAWQNLLTRAAHLLLAAPQEMVGCVTNAVYNIWQADPRKCSVWLGEMITLVPLCADVRAFREAGKVVAWRCGLPNFRAGALDALQNLSVELATASLGLKTGSTDLKTLAERLKTDPWLHPACLTATRQLRLVAQVGDFIGFGGQFQKPPEVFLKDGSFYVVDGQSFYIVEADVFGAMLYPADKPLAYSIVRTNPELGKDGWLNKALGLIDKATAPQAKLSFEKGDVLSGTNRTHFTILETAASYAVTDSVVVVTTTDSHRVYVVADCAVPQVN